MTPTPAWYEADADDSDRNVTDDVAANAPQAPRGANLPAADVPGGVSDADLLRKRTAALNRTSAENERLRAEVEQKERLLRTMDHWAEAAETCERKSNEWAARAEAAEAKLRDVEAERDALRSALERTEANFRLAVSGKPVRDMAETLAESRAVLARSQAPQAPAEQEPVITPGATPFAVCSCLRCGPPFREPGEDWRARSPWPVSWMALCPTCGDKRCPGAADHREHPKDPPADAHTPEERILRDILTNQPE